jgi:ureidoacrylate peracid hydrolase
MAHAKYDPKTTALLVIDPYNDFISEGGKAWGVMKGVAEANDCVPHMLQVLTAARRAGIRVVYVPHRRFRPGDYEGWRHIAPIQKLTWQYKIFEEGTWGGEFRSEFLPQPGDLIALEHWGSSGFANTDLDVLLKRHEILRVIVVGLRVNTCVESTVRYAAEQGYDVVMVRDATAGMSDEEMHAALNVSIPHYASVVTAQDVVDALT